GFKQRTIRKEPKMPETTYLPQVRCEISEGLTGSDKTICVRDVDGRRQYIHVLPSLVNWVSDTPYLPVGVINVDYRNNRVLIELPIEADSGTNRMWMPIDAFRVESGVPA
ncbi:MAG: hypothetical protein ABSE84_32590, partial [Isosphaeraceae bacterium]